MSTQRNEGIARRRTDNSHSAQNPAAWRQEIDEVAPVIKDTKSTHASALAIELATSSSWSENASPSTSTQAIDRLERLTNMETLHDSRSHELSTGTYPDAPPAYSSHRSYMSHEINPSGSENRIRSPGQAFEDRSPSLGTPGGSAPSQNNLGTSNQDDSWANEVRKSLGWPRFGKVAVTPDTLSWRSICSICFLLILSIGIFGSCNYQSPRQPLPQVLTQKVHTQQETVNDIRGDFKLYDTLELSTTTGNIDIAIDLQPGNVTAQLCLTSSTGAIKLGISESWFARRESRDGRPIHTVIKTVEGNVRARILLGNGGSALVESVTGKQDIDVFVYAADVDDTVSELSTRSHTGNQRVRLMNFGGRDATIHTLVAQHRSLGTANVDLQYTRDWKGQVHGIASAVGNVKVWKDGYLVFDKNEQREVLAHKGKEAVRNTVKLISDGTGSISFKSWFTW